MKNVIKNIVLVLVALLTMSCEGKSEDIPYPDPPKVNFPGPQHGTGWEEYDFDYYVQKPWNVDLDERYKCDSTTGEHTLWVFKDDEPFKQGDHTSPRCEIRIRNDYTEGNHQFEADYYVTNGSYNSIIMQIFGYPIALNLRVYNEDGGTMKWFQTRPIETKIYDRWVHVNVVHMFDEQKVYVYLDGRLKGNFNVKETAPSYYFKCGVYTCQSEKSEVRIKNIKCYKQK